MAVAKLWAVNALAIELEINPTSLGRIVARLEPASSVNGMNTYLMADVVRLLLNRSAPNGVGDELNPQMEKAKLDEARRRKVDLEIAELEGSMVKRDEVYQAMTDMVHTCKSRLRGLPAKVLHRIMGCASYEEALPILEAEIEEALIELSETI